jgi:hypothetical protein
MKTYIGIDYHKRFSYGTIMTEAGTIVKQARFNNHPDAVAAFLGDIVFNCAQYNIAIFADRHTAWRVVMELVRYLRLHIKRHL